jgi:hypothetical protein
MISIGRRLLQETTKLLATTILLAACAALLSRIGSAQPYDTPETRRQRADAEKRAQEQAKRNEEPKKPSLEQKKAEAMEYLGKRFQYVPNPSASNRIRFYERIPPSSHSQDPSYLFTPLSVSSFVVRGVVMSPPTIFALGEDEYLLEIEFPDGKTGYVNVVGCCGIKEHLFRGEVDSSKEYVQFEGTSPSIDDIVAREKARQEKQAQEERKAQQRAEKKAEQERAKRLQEQRRQAAKPSPRIGMTRQQVVNDSNWGRPYDINRTTSVSGVREQWVYDNRRYLYFDNGVLTAIQD